MAHRVARLRVVGMTCEHCTGRVQRALLEVPGVTSADVRLPDIAEVTGNADLAAVRDAVLDAGYELDETAPALAEPPAEPPAPPIAPLRMAALVRTSIPVFGMTCASCVSAVERSLSKVDGVVAASVNLAAQRATVEVSGEVDIDRLRSAVERVGYSSPVVEAGADEQALADRARTEEIAHNRRDVAIAAPLAAVVMALAMVPMVGGPAWPWSPWVAMALTSVVMVVPGRRFLHGLVTPLRTGVAGMDTLVGLGTVAAFIWSIVALLAGHGAHGVWFESAAVTIAFVRIGNLMESKARYEASDGLRQLSAKVPRSARLLDGREVAMGEVIPGDRVQVAAGEAVPVDGVVEVGRSLIDASSLTGESVGGAVGPGDAVLGGAFAVDGALVVRATRPGADSAIARVAALVRQAQEGRAPVQRLADQVAARFVPAVLAISLVTGLTWAWLGGASEAVARASAVLLVACPCALGLATPIAVLVGSGAAARRGVLFRDAEALERAAGLKTMILDKTGTLTEGRPRVTRVVCRDGVSEGEVRSRVAAMEAGAGHPLALALRALDAAAPADRSITVVAGRGVRGVLDGVEWLVGSAGFLAENGVSVADEDVGTAVYVARGGEWIATIFLEDTVRPDASAALARLRARGLRLVLATGDREAPAWRSWFGEHLFVRQLPEDKLALVKRSPGPVGMVGDGINDTPALAAADVGFSVGAAADVARGTARVTLLRDDVGAVADAVEFAQRTLSIIRQNLAFAFGYNLLMIPLAAGVGARWGLTLTPMLASAAMSMSSVLVVTNSLRLRGR
jgi:Cu+-exporting ATPase